MIRAGSGERDDADHADEHHRDEDDRGDPDAASAVPGVGRERVEGVGALVVEVGDVTPSEVEGSAPGPAPKCRSLDSLTLARDD
jgi:hypothetical protein